MKRPTGITALGILYILGGIGMILLAAMMGILSAGLTEPYVAAGLAIFGGYIAIVLYLRVSGRGQVGGHGFTRQREAITKYAKLHGYEVVGEFKDAGVSGTTELADRVGLAALLDHLQSNGVRTVAGKVQCA